MPWVRGAFSPGKILKHRSSEVAGNTFISSYSGKRLTFFFAQKRPAKYNWGYDMTSNDGEQKYNVNSFKITFLRTIFHCQS